MNWPVIGLLITFIVISVSIAAYSIVRSVDNAKMLMYNLNYYKELANKYGLQLTRIGELVEEYNDTSRDLYDQAYAEIVETVIHNIKSLVKIVGR
ncbi:hypothetical protein LCGC14_1796130 [marine sediment metagenome]|uniref:Uncharacterized protein n=1 Tax=marine sediment metagenome TaxID=412755 RepID=A0A0F9J5X1_9ZZZZ|nr:hypothetical protein [Candidatus Aminicenantes bacterium]